MFLKPLALLSALALSTNALLSNITIFDPPSNYTIPRTLYARTLLLNQDCETTSPPVLLATWENYGPNNDTNPYFPIYQSLDSGETWTERSRVHDQVNGWGLRYQPFLYELPYAVGDYPAGTVLLAGNSIPEDLSITQLDLYASRDKGYTWTFVSHIARGGEAIPDNGLTPVWEPSLMVYDGILICFYSDQRDWPAHGQKLVHQTTSNLHNWTSVVTDVAYANNSFRPGMPIVSELPFGNYIYTYEFYGAVEGPFAVYYRIASSPLLFADSSDHALVASDGTVPLGSPYNVWLPVGGALGTIVVSCGGQSEVFVNQNLGAEGSWTKVQTGAATSYSRSLRVLEDETVLIVGGGVLGGEENMVLASSIDVRPVGPKLAMCANGTYGYGHGHGRGGW